MSGLTPDQYLDIERAEEFRHEFFAGKMNEMPASSFRHSVLTSTLLCEIGDALAAKPCVALNGSLRLRAAPNGLHTYPDVMVVCGQPQFADDQQDTLLNPVAIVEVLSPATEAYDRGLKFSQYRGIESLQEYALVSQNEPRIEIFRRQQGGTWVLTEFVGLAAACRFESIDVSVALVDIYEKVTFEPGEPAPPR